MSVLILTAAAREDGTQPFLTKRITKTEAGWTKEAYDRAFFYNAYEAEITGIYELSELLTMLEDMPHACIVRAEVIPGRSPDGITRRKDDYNDGHPPCLREQPQGRPWIMIDFDKEPIPDRIGGTRQDRLAYLVSILPKWFHGVTYHFQWSSSEGLGDPSLASAHLWFWLETPWPDSILTERMQREIIPGGLRGWGVDESVCRTVQPNYTASPVFENCTDPLAGERSGLVIGDRDAVDLPPPVFPKPPKRVGPPPTPGQAFEAKLKQIGPHYHAPIIAAIAHYVGIHKQNTDVDYLIQRVTDAIHDAPEGRNPKSTYLRRSYLEANVNGAIRKFV